MPASGPRRSLYRSAILSTAVAAALLAAPFAYAQEPSAGASQAAGANTPSTESPRSTEPRGPGILGTLIPGSQINATVGLSETYTTNAVGISGSSSADYLTQFSLGLGLHEHSARVSLDANYSGAID